VTTPSVTVHCNSTAAVASNSTQELGKLPAPDAATDPTALAGAALLEPVAGFATDEAADAGPEAFGDTLWLSDDASRAVVPGAAQPDPQNIAPTMSTNAAGATACTWAP